MKNVIQEKQSMKLYDDCASKGYRYITPLLAMAKAMPLRVCPSRPTQNALFSRSNLQVSKRAHHETIQIGSWEGDEALVLWHFRINMMRCLILKTDERTEICSMTRVTSTLRICRQISILNMEFEVSYGSNFS